jgi:hypothetical protein
MANDYFKLSAEEKRDVLAVASNESGRPAHLLEKDIWVVWALRQLYESAEADHLVFKGGTSLSKAYRAIQRFSEDIDITYDIRVIAADLVAQTPEGLPTTRSQQERWTADIRNRLKEWLAGKMLPYFQERLSRTDNSAKASATDECLIIDYEAVATGTGYVAPRIKIEFGARSDGEPSETHTITTDAAPYLNEIVFPECNVRTMAAERTFWEKATAIHVFCLQGKLHGERFARHWYDVAQLDKIGLVNMALKNRELAKKVAEHKSIFFREKARDGNLIDYQLAVNGGLQLVPEGEAKEILSDDYRKMLEDGLLPEGAEIFDKIMARCTDIQRRANEVAGFRSR